jgi:phosphatidylserine/phosphatidylglycerophosphate/cardiolipin synthase-like enzyme
MGSIVAPDKLNVVSNNYRDPEDVAYGQWAASTKFPAEDGNLATPFINGADAFAQMALDFETAKNETHAIYLIGFETSTDTPMGSSTLADLLTAAARRKVMVRGILNGDGTRRAALALGRNWGLQDNTPLHNHILGLKDLPEQAPLGAACFSFLDDHCGIAGAHHQKITIIQGENGLIAYCGGIDLQKKRAKADSWHDVNCRFVGPAAYHLYETFAERWADNEDMFTIKLGWPSLIAPMPQAGVGGNVTTYTVQIARTYPWLAKPAAYAPLGRRGSYKMILNAIQKATKFIYVEDQFMVCADSDFVDALKARLALESFKYLVILTLDNQTADMVLKQQAQYRRDKLVGELRRAAPDKVFACVRKDLYVHAKTWIFDDKFAIIGSANCNNRGYFSDSEVVAGISDKNAGGTRLWFAHRLRMALWMKHLDLAEKDVLDLDDTLVSKWKTPTAKIDVLDTTFPAGAKFSNREWAAVDPST